MKTRRSVTSRNFLGGFLGGFLGICAFHLFNLLLPVGCLVGCVIGWWHEEMLAAFPRNYMKARLAFARFYREAVASPSQIFKEYLHHLRAALKIDTGGVLAKFAFGFVAAWVATIRWGYKACAGVKKAVLWPFQDRRNVITIGNVIAVIIFLTIIVYAFLYVSLPIAYGYVDDPRQDFLAVLVLQGFAWIIALATPVTLGIACGVDGHRKEEKEPVTHHIRDYSWYTRHGLLAYMARKLSLIAAYFLLVLLWEVLEVAYLLLGVVSVLFLMTVTIVAAMFAVCGLWRFAAARSHWPCFIATLTVTLVTALSFGTKLEGTYLWTAALLTGFAAGAASELAHRSLASFLVRRPRLIKWARKKIDDPIDDLIVPLWKSYHRPLRKYMVGWLEKPDIVQI